MQPSQQFKRGQRVEYTYAAGAVVPGKVVRRETDERWLGWYVCELTDEGGSYRGCVHGGQLRVIGNC